MPYPSISWTQEDLPDNLKSLSDHAIEMAEGCRRYYASRSPSKRRWARGLRIIAIIATSLGGIIPILSQIADKTKFAIDPAWSTVFISVAITAIGLDRFFGFSSAWMRFVTADVKIQSKIDGYLLAIESEKFSWAGQKPDFEKGRSMLTIIMNFINEVNEIVKDETNTWMVEFQSVIQKFNEESNVKAESSKLGGVVVTIENGDQFPNGVRIQLEGQAAVNFTGSTYSFNNLYPKIYRLSVSGVLGGKPVQAESLVNVTPGVISAVTVGLK